MKLIIFLTALLLGFCTGSPVIGGSDVGTLEIKKQNKIVNNPGTYNYVVLLELFEVINEHNKLIKDIKNCGGILVTTEVVMSAAHCLNDFITEPIVEVIAGIVHRTLDMGGQRMKTKDYMMHDDFHTSSGVRYNENDISLIWLESPFILTRRVKLAHLANPSVNLDRKDVYVVGFGTTSTGYVSEMMKEGKMQVISQQKCKTEHKGTQILNSMICAQSDSNDVVHCFGDSGGPLVMDGKVVGISSWVAITKMVRDDGKNINICDPTGPGVYTRVSNYRTWIRQQVQLGPPMERKSHKVPASLYHSEVIETLSTPASLRLNKKITKNEKKRCKKNKKNCVIL